MPTVSVVMPVYNGEKFLRPAIESILGQSFTDFEFIIVNDGSTDNSENIILSYSDTRIRLIRNNNNLGIIGSLNRGIESARGEYICRMDADDVSVADRLKLQIDFMNGNPSIAVVGGNTIVIDGDGNELKRENYPATMAEIKRSIFVHNPFAHGAVLIRSSVFKECGFYDKRYVHTEDYDLWLRIAVRHQLANLHDTLLLRRIHESNITVTEETALIGSRIRTLANAIFHYYRKPACAVYLARPVASYLYRRLRTLWQ